jgi:hypothetical protein
MTPARFEPDDEAPLIGDKEVDEGKTEDETEEGERDGGEEMVVGGGVVIVAEDRDGNVVEGNADTEVGVARVENVMLDWDSGGRIPVELDADGGGEDGPP